MGYPSDLTDEQWDSIKHHFETGNNMGKHLRVHDKRDLVNAVLYARRAGCQWDMLPDSYPNRSTVVSFYRRAVSKGLLSKIYTALGQNPHDEEFRKHLVKMSYEGRRTVKSLAKAHGICPDTLHDWRKKYAFLEDEVRWQRMQNEIKELWREINRLKKEINSANRITDSKTAKSTKTTDNA